MNSVIAAIIVLSTIVVAFSLYNREKTTHTPEVTSVQSAPISSQKSQTQSPTPLPDTVSPQALTLGGSEQAFIDQYGQPTQTNNYNIDDYVDETNNLSVGIDYVNTFSGNPSTYSVYFITLSTVSGAVWTATKSKSICNSYLPKDAKYVKVVPSTSQTTGMGVILMYYSASLANTVPAGYFYDYYRKGVLPGTIYLDYSYQYPSDNSHIWMCALGTAQTSA